MSSNKHSSKQSITRIFTLANLVLLLILIGALAIRWLFSTGINDPTELTNFDRVVRSVETLKSGSYDLASWMQLARNELGGIRNLIYYLPNILIYTTMGISQFSSLVLSVVLSAVGVLLIYGITNLVTKDSKSSLMSALIWAFFPLEIFFSTSAPRITVITFFVLLGIYAFLLGLKTGSWLAYGLEFLSLVALFLWQPQLLALVVLIIASGYITKYTSFQRRNLVIPLVLLSTLILVWNWGRASSAFIDFYHLLLDQPEMTVYFPLFVVAITVLFLEGKNAGKPYLTWSLLLVLSFLGLVTFFSPSLELDLFNVGVYLQLLFAFLVGLTGIYLSKSLDQKQGLSWSGVLVVVGILGAGLAVLGSKPLIPPYNGWDWIGLHSLFLLYSICAGIAFAGVMVSPILITGASRKWKTGGRFVLLVVILLASLSYSWSRRNTYYYLTEAPAQALSYLGETNTPGPVYILDGKTSIRVNYWLNMDGKSLNNHPPVRVISEDQFDQVREGLILAFDDELTKGVPETWWRVGSFGSLGKPRIDVYEIHPIFQSNLQGILGSWGLCDQYRRWLTDNQNNTDQIRSIPYQSDSECFTRTENEVGLPDLLDPSNREGYVYFPAKNQDELTIAQITLPIYDPRTISIPVELSPNSLYLYSIEVMSQSPTMTLFWRAGDIQDFFEMRPYAEWTTVSLLLLTPNWDAPSTVSFSPVLFDHLDAVNVRNLFIGLVEVISR